MSPSLSADLSVRLASRIFGEDEVPLDDPAEHYHEASKLYPAFAARATRAQELAHDALELRLRPRREINGRRRCRHS